MWLAYSPARPGKTCTEDLADVVKRSLVSSSTPRVSMLIFKPSGGYSPSATARHCLQGWHCSRPLLPWTTRRQLGKGTSVRVAPLLLRVCGRHHRGLERATAPGLPRQDARSNRQVGWNAVGRTSPETASRNGWLYHASVDEYPQRLPDFPGTGREELPEFGLGDLRAAGRVKPGQQGEEGRQWKAREAQSGHSFEGFGRNLDGMPLVTHAPN